MELYKGKWCITGSELIISPENPDGFMTWTTYINLTKRKQINVLRRGCRNTPALIEFDSLPMRYRDQIIEQIGFDPRVKPPHNCIATSLERDEQAREFFKKHLTPNGEKLLPGTQEEYGTNADILNTLHEMANRIRGDRRSRGNGTRGMWDTLTEELRSLDRSQYPHSLPTNPVRLREKLNRYLKEGPVSLIHRGHGNHVAEKLSEQSRRWLLARWSNMVEKATSVEHLFELYNQEAITRDWKPLQSVSTIRNFLFDPQVKHLWWGVRYGQVTGKNKFALQHSTSLPTMRDSLWYSDGTKLNYFYLNEEGKVETCSVYEVMDAYSEVLLGYHISKTEDYQAQYRAYKMAIQFSGQKPYQIGYDNQGGHRKLENGNFLNKVAHLAIRTQPYNGKSKTIESAFGRFQDQFMKQDWYFTGQNITATTRESRANMEFILGNKHNLKSLDEIARVYALRREQWNQAAHPATGKPRIEMYRESVNPKAVKVNLWDMVDIFWIMRPEPVTLNAYGLSFTDKKVKYDYLVYRDGTPDIEWHRSNIDRKFWIKYDPDDLSLVYLYKKDSAGQLRFATEAMTKVVVARGKQEQTCEDAVWIHTVNEANKREIIKDNDDVNKVLREFHMAPEDYGLNSPGIPGITKTRGRTPRLGQIQKALSNITLYDDEEEKSIYDLM
jgi:hypothetical protein